MPTIIQRVLKIFTHLNNGGNALCGATNPSLMFKLPLADVESEQDVNCPQCREIIEKTQSKIKAVIELEHENLIIREAIIAGWAGPKVLSAYKKRFEGIKKELKALYPQTRPEHLVMGMLRETVEEGSVV